MRQASNYRVSVMWLAVAGGLLACGGVAHADFTFGEPTNLGPQINSEGSDGLTISSDGLSIFFFSDRLNGATWDLYTAVRETTEDEWDPAVNPGSPLNGPRSEGYPSISADGLELFYTAPSWQAGWTEFGQADLWVSRRSSVSVDWSAPQNLGAVVNTPFHDTEPSISADGLELYFSSTRPGGYGEWNIWVTTRQTKDDPWQEPVNLGPTINSGDEFTPNISANGLVLFFGSSRSGGYGESDIWLTTRKTKTAPWGYPVNLGPPINDSNAQWAPCLSHDNSTLYFTDLKKRPRYGYFDIWQVEITLIVDFNNDGMVDSEDLTIMRDHWGLNEPLCDIGPTPWGDGVVDTDDLMVLAEYIPEIRSPRAEAEDLPRDVSLSWIGSPLADSYDVYFGTSFEDVTNADRDDPLDVLISQGQSVSTYEPNGLLEFGQTYYWRVDEVSASPGSTVYRGCVWEFTTESYAYPIGGITATASNAEEGSGPEHTIDGSGLNASDEHSTVGTDMWLAAGNGVDPVWIQYEFDRVYSLNEMLVWNYNTYFELMLGLGIKDATVEHSTNGTDWTALDDVPFAQATARSDYSANTTVDFGGAAAKYVRLTVKSGWGMMGQFGLSEVRFSYIPTRARAPQPADGETGVHIETTLNWHAGREAASHEVYLSTDRQAVVDGTALVDTVTESSYQPSALDPGQTYYWKVNEINETEAITSWQGNVWEFSTAE